jgi:hypothetical protein
MTPLQIVLTALAIATIIMTQALDLRAGDEPLTRR